MKKKLIRAAAASVMAVSLTGGVAAANAGTIDHTGPDSYNKVESRQHDSTRVKNNNNVRVQNNNPQWASTGDATVRHNTTGGGAATGAATNDSLLRASVRVNNSGAAQAAMSGNGSGNVGGGSISNTGPDSYNKVSSSSSSHTSVQNNNNVSVQNNNWQKAVSGDAKVSGNTTGGGATSGNATNISTNETTVEITN